MREFTDPLESLSDQQKMSHFEQHYERYEYLLYGQDSGPCKMARCISRMESARSNAPSIPQQHREPQTMTRLIADVAQRSRRAQSSTCSSSNLHHVAQLDRSLVNPVVPPINLEIGTTTRIEMKLMGVTQKMQVLASFDSVNDAVHYIQTRIEYFHIPGGKIVNEGGIRNQIFLCSAERPEHVLAESLGVGDRCPMKLTLLSVDKSYSED